MENKLVLQTSNNYAYSAIRDAFIQMPSRNISIDSWKAYRNQIASYFGTNAVDYAFKKLINSGWIKKTKDSYKWKSMYKQLTESMLLEMPHLEYGKFTMDFFIEKMKNINYSEKANYITNYRNKGICGKLNDKWLVFTTGTNNIKVSESKPDLLELPDSWLDYIEVYDDSDNKINALSFFNYFIENK